MISGLIEASVRASDSVGDPSATRTVYVTIVLLALLGVFFIALAFWVVRSTRPEPELLAPLEIMDRRAWRTQDPATRRRLLDDVRPEGSTPVDPSKSVPDVVSDFASERPVVSFDDLTDGEVESEVESVADVVADVEVEADIVAESVADVDAAPEGAPGGAPAASEPAPTRTAELDAAPGDDDAAQVDAARVDAAQDDAAQDDAARDDADHADDAADADDDAVTVELDRPASVAHDATMMSAHPISGIEPRSAWASPDPGGAIPAGHLADSDADPAGDPDPDPEGDGDARAGRDDDAHAVARPDPSADAGADAIVDADSRPDPRAERSSVPGEWLLRDPNTPG